MTFDEYQREAADTAVYSRDTEIIALVYTTLGLAGEAGELANKVKKILRDNESVVTEHMRNELADEAGDVLWYLARFTAEITRELEDVAENNLEKLRDRKRRGVIAGAGDRR
jgi:NTP pyrophosphatase (non-canonical NTP hydrolase)